MVELLSLTHFHLVGIKGVAMTALAQCLQEAGKSVTGSDVAEDFVTAKLLKELHLSLQTGFQETLPSGTECVIYTAAHGGKHNPQVQLALAQNLPVLSHAEALGQLFNHKQGIAVSGVGGKSTTSAMITWILRHAGLDPSFAIGVGNIPGIEQTGHWSDESTLFVAEADEYAMQPPTGESNWHLVPRFSFLQPQVTVCTNLAFDHPDVYQDFNQTKAVFKAFFDQLKPAGTLIYNSDNEADIRSLWAGSPAPNLVSFGTAASADIKLVSYSATPGTTTTVFEASNQTHTLMLQIPGQYNALNALAAVGAAQAVGVELSTGVAALANFRSTQRRFEFMGEKQGVKYYDDYAHHPHEVSQAIKALNEWYPTERKVIAFQSHTFSRTKELFGDFVTAFAEAPEVVMIDIFPSAREKFDASVSSDTLCSAIKSAYPDHQVQNVKTIEQLASYCRQELKAGDVCLTLGAGDIYQVHQQL